MSFFSVIKSIVPIVVDIGTGIIVGHYTGSAVKSAKGICKVCAAVAATCVSGLIGSKASDWANEQLDEVKEAVDRVTNKEVTETDGE